MKFEKIGIPVYLNEVNDCGIFITASFLMFVFVWKLVISVPW